MRGSILFGMILFLGISTSYGSELNEFFFENPSTNLTFSKPFEDQGELKVIILGEQGEMKRILEKALKTSIIGWENHYEEKPPYCRPICKVELLIGSKLYNLLNCTLLNKLYSLK